MRDRQPVNLHAAGAAREIAQLLREHGDLTAEEIARRRRSKTVVVRVHLRSLEGAGLVARTFEPRPVGRPVGRYRLTAAADALFPKRYDDFSAHLIEAMIAEHGEDAFRRILSRWEDRLHAHLDASLPAEPMPRLMALAKHQTAHGFMASVRTDQEGVALVERNCPIAAIAARYPEICEAEAALFGRTLRWKTSLVSCQAKGDGVCVFRIGRRPSRVSAGLDGA
jgi:predicted ArsR family transcriptional regulator